MSTDPAQIADLSDRRKQREHRRYADLVMETWDRMAAADRYGARTKAEATEKAERFERFDILNTVRRKARDTL